MDQAQKELGKMQQTLMKILEWAVVANIEHG
jgi:hypothetical protein